MAIKIRSGGEWIPVGGGGGEPVGTIIAWGGGGQTLPQGYVLCDGTALSRTTYSALFDAIGVTNGSGDGSSTFNIPNLVDRFIVGASNTSGDTTYPGVSPSATGGSANAVLVAHNHTYIDQYVVIDAGYRPWPASNNDCQQRNINTSTAGIDANGNTNTSQSGTNANLPPYYALCYIIKVFNTVAEVTVNQPAGPGIPEGVIVMWSGATNNIPDGFVLCNGSNGTPNLQNKFIVGAGSSYSVNATGGSNSVTLNTAQIPSHFHQIFNASNNSGSHPNQSNINANSYVARGTGAVNHNEGYNMRAAGSSATRGKTSNVGSGNSHENRPPYYALAYIMKTA